jgi:thiamine biosynthesis protein ThiS
MTTILLNGEPRDFEDPLTIERLIRSAGLLSASVAVAVNSEVVPRSEFETFALKERDRVEIIRAVGGG